MDQQEVVTVVGLAVVVRMAEDMVSLVKVSMYVTPTRLSRS